MTADLSDDELIVRVARGDGAAFASLVFRHQGRLLALAMRVTGGRAAAEDVVQECFTRAWVQAPRWRPLGGGRTHGVAAWLSRVTLNLALDQSRLRRHAPLETAPEAPDPSLAADEAIIAAERHAWLSAAVRALPERQRAAISLSYDAGLSNAEAAAVLETSIGAFELLLVRARRALRTGLLQRDSHDA